MCITINDASNKWIYNYLCNQCLSPGPPIDILQGGKRLLRGLGDRLRLLSKLRIWRPIKPLVNFHMINNQYSEFYVIIFLNKLIIVENIPKNEQIKIKRLWLRLWGPSVNHGPFLDSQDPEPMYRLNPPLIGPA